MHVVYQTLLDILFPRTQYERWLTHIDALFIHKQCPPGSLTGLPLGIRALFTYNNQHVAALVHQMKFFRQRACVELIAQLMSTEIAQEWRTFAQQPCIILTTIPVRKRRLRQYGYCQGALLATQICTQLKSQKIPCSYMQFLRRKSVLIDREQKLLSRKKRLRRKNPFIWRRRKITLPTDGAIHIWIIDDVATTGFTLDMARETIYQNLPLGVSVTIRCLAFAH